MTKAICQECGQELTSWTEKHTIQDCGNYHLKRAQEILDFDLNQLKTVCNDWANTAQQLQYDNGQLEGVKNCFERCYKELESKIENANKILAELDVSLFATGEERKDGTEYHNFNIDKWYAQLKEALSTSESQASSEGKT